MYAERPIIPKIKPEETTLATAPFGFELAEPVEAGRATVDDPAEVDRLLAVYRVSLTPDFKAPKFRYMVITG